MAGATVWQIFLPCSITVVTFHTAITYKMIRTGMGVNGNLYINQNGIQYRVERKYMNQDKTPLLEAVQKLISTKPAYFRVPGHRLENGIDSRWTDFVGTKIFAYDVTETPFTDDLHCPEGAILEAQQLLANLYGADKSFFLVNGTTCGNEAMILSAALEGQEIMIARNAHKSALMGLILSGAKPVSIMPEVLPQWGIQGGISPEIIERTFQKHPNCKALFLVSPSYYGIASDLQAIAEICHAYGALLLVDEAHGGHCYFHKLLPTGALKCGADICVQSMHKVAGALTQSSVMHIKSHGIADDCFASVPKNLQLLQSTSPNYLLMISLDCARHQLAVYGSRMMEKALFLADYARTEIRKIFGFRCMGNEVTGVSEIKAIDLTRLVISAKEIGLTGYALEQILFEQYAVNMELADDENVLAIVTYANTKEDMERLVEACRDISSSIAKDKKAYEKNLEGIYQKEAVSYPLLPEQVFTPRQAYFAQTSKIPWKEAIGKVSAQTIAPYPPGIPILYSGERITKEIWNFLEYFRQENRHIHGTEDGKLDYILVIQEAYIYEQ